MPSRTLKSLLNHVDDWFKDLTLDPPIEQFQLEVDKKDRAKLAVINRTTNNWFQAFNSIELLTNEGVTREDLGIDDELEDGDNVSDVPPDPIPKRQCRKKTQNVKKTKVATRAIREPNSKAKRSLEEAEESRLDSLVQDLEQLLEQEVEDELVCDLHQIYPSDDIALHCDSSIGHCVTIDMQPQVTVDAQQSQSNKRPTKSSGQLPSYSIVVMATRSRSSATRLGQLNASPATATPAPSKDHNYIIAPQVMMPVCMNKCKMEHSILNKAERRAARAKRDRLAVLNTGAIKRFARFSDRFRVLSEKQESIKLEA